MANLTKTQMVVLKAAADRGDAGRADLSRRVRARTIAALQADGFLYSKNIDGLVEITPRGEGALA
jgi:hypothetical protein